MPVGQYHILGPIFAAIGRECAAIAGDIPDQAYFYADARKESCTGDGIFVDEGKLVRFHEPSDKLCNLVRRARAAQSKDKWVVMEYRLTRRAFDVALLYPDEIAPKLSPSDGRRAFIRRHFGSKAVVATGSRRLELDARSKPRFANEPEL